jgi:hypothetical protein
MNAYEVHAHETHACKMHAHEVHACELYVCEVHACEILSNGGWRCGTRVSIESMEEWQPIYTEVGGVLAGMPS